MNTSSGLLHVLVAGSQTRPSEHLVEAGTPRSRGDKQRCPSPVESNGQTHLVLSLLLLRLITQGLQHIKAEVSNASCLPVDQILAEVQA